MHRYQANLPQLPVCEPHETMSILLPTMSCMATSQQELTTTTQKFQDFIQTTAIPKLQPALLEYAKSCQAKTNEYLQRLQRGEKIPPSLHPDGSNYPSVHFLEATWDAMAYLAWQDSISCFSNVMTAMMDSTTHTDPLLRATWLALGIADFGIQLYDDVIEADKGLCSAQYSRILYTARIPGEKQDRIVTTVPDNPFPSSTTTTTISTTSGPYADRQSRTHSHFVVICRDHFYQVPIARDTSPVSLYKTFQSIRADADKRGNAPVPLPRVTGNRRDVWAQARVALKASSLDSAESLRSIEEAMFHLVLSEERPVGSAAVQNGLASDRSIWLDKSTSIIVFKNGTCGANLEHAAADAVVPSRMLVHACDYAVQNDERVLGSARNIYKGAAKTKVKVIGYTENGSKTEAKYLKFDLGGSTTILDAVAEGSKQLDEITSDNLVATVTVKTVDNDKIKKLAVASPDSFMQLCLQIAYAIDQQTTIPPATYETASTRAFLHGRTECIRTQSPQTRAFVEAFLNGNKNKQLLGEKELTDIRTKLEKAAISHRTYSTKCSNGKGGDRHMLMLRVMAAQLGDAGKLHPIYSDPLYVRSSAYTLSTSQLPWAVYDHPGFGAPFPDAYGCCYRFAPDQIVATVTSRPKSCKEKNATRFARTIENVVVDVYEMMVKAKQFQQPATTTTSSSSSSTKDKKSKL
jgi:hypothetical protein